LSNIYTSKEKNIAKRSGESINMEF